MSAEMDRWAELSANGLYRYRLGRRWGDADSRALFVMLNPSTADAEVDDPTVRRCVGFAKRFGCGSLEVVNLYAYRATRPTELVEAAGAGIDVSGGLQADAWMAHSVGELRGGPVVAAWGAYSCSAMRSIHRDRIARVRSIVEQTGRSFHCLGVTASGAPKHPLYLSADATLSAWPIGGAS